jgi:hypothetical protein
MSVSLRRSYHDHVAISQVCQQYAFLPTRDAFCLATLPEKFAEQPKFFYSAATFAPHESYLAVAPFTDGMQLDAGIAE